MGGRGIDMVSEEIVRQTERDRERDREREISGKERETVSKRKRG